MKYFRGKGQSTKLHATYSQILQDKSVCVYINNNDRDCKTSVIKLSLGESGHEVIWEHFNASLTATV